MLGLFYFAWSELRGPPPKIRWGIRDGLNKLPKEEFDVQAPEPCKLEPAPQSLSPGVEAQNSDVLAQGHPTSRLLANRRNLERKIPSWQLPVTFELELVPGRKPLIAVWQYSRRRAP